MRRRGGIASALLGGLVAAASVGATQIDNRALAAETDGTNWASYGRTFSENHYSPLTQINEGNVRQLGLKWFYDIDGLGSLYTTPLAIDGILYFSLGYSIVHAVDARTGRLLWRYDPDSPRAGGEKIRHSWGARGIAFWEGKVYTATMDGRLIALDAQTGKVAWSVQTTEGPGDGRYITGAPWVFNGKVVIGHGGADYAPVRGYVTAYDARTGRQIWRFYTVPGDPSQGFENSAMAMAAKTWSGQWWKFGGGGTVWNAMAYDPQFNRLYIGTGNGTPWNRKIRSPGGGDNLFLCSIVALNADTGEYVWHYQTTPGETWDFVSAMDIELTTLEIGGHRRPVILHAPKNGFFYVIDRTSGKLISAEKVGRVTWAERVDLASGRPVENPAARYPDGQGAVVYPGPAGVHNAEPMSFNPVTGLVYIPVREIPFYYTDEGIDLAHWQPAPGLVYINGIAAKAGPTPLPPPKYGILAWDPVHQHRVWSRWLDDNQNSGVTSTGGKLVLEGTAQGRFIIYAADTGQELWSFDAQTGVSGTPIVYSVDGREYITVLAGYRGIVVSSPWDFYAQPRRVLTFALGGTARLPPRAAHEKRFVESPEVTVDPQKAAQGAIVALSRCSDCHGIGFAAGGSAPDLRESHVPSSLESLTDVLKNGRLESAGMPRFADLTTDEIEQLQHYIVTTAREAAHASPNSHTGTAVGIRQ